MTTISETLRENLTFERSESSTTIINTKKDQRIFTISGHYSDEEIRLFIEIYIGGHQDGRKDRDADFTKALSTKTEW